MFNEPLKCPLTALNRNWTNQIEEFSPKSFIDVQIGLNFVAYSYY